MNIAKRLLKSKISSKDGCFMTLVMLYGYFKCEILSNMFLVKAFVFEKIKSHWKVFSIFSFKNIIEMSQNMNKTFLE